MITRDRTSEMAKPRPTAIPVKMMCLTVRTVMSSVWSAIQDQSMNGVLLLAWASRLTTQPLSPWSTTGQAAAWPVTTSGGAPAGERPGSQEPARLKQWLVHADDLLAAGWAPPPTATTRPHASATVPARTDKVSLRMGCSRLPGGGRLRPDRDPLTQHRGDRVDRQGAEQAALVVDDHAFQDGRAEHGRERV